MAGKGTLRAIKDKAVDKKAGVKEMKKESLESDYKKKPSKK